MFILRRTILGIAFFFSLLLMGETRAEDSPAFDARFFASPAAQRLFLVQANLVLDSKQPLSKARRHYQIARKQNPKDPRLDYALGLAVLKKFDYEEATKLFQTAAENENAVYLPAWQSLIGLHLMQGSGEAFQKDTLKLAQLAVNANAQWIGEDQAPAAAAWLGEVGGYLSLPKVEFLKPEDRTAWEQQLKTALGSTRLADWNRGLAQLRERHAELKQEIQEKQQEVKTRLEQSANKTTTKLSERKQELEQQQKEAQQSATEWKAWYDKQIKLSQTQLAQLQKDYIVLDAVGKRLNGIILQTQQDIYQLNLQVQNEQRTRSNAENRRRAFFGPNGNEILLARKQQELLRYQQQYSALEQQAFRMISQAKQTMAARQAIVIRYQTATGQIVQKDQALARWKSMVEKSSLKAAAKANDTNPLEALEKRLTIVSSYFPMDFETEKTRLLKSYSGT